MANERRRRNERRQGERCHFPGESINVTRVEHENLFHVVEQLLQKLRVLERDLRDHRDRLDQIETGLGRPPAPNCERVLVTISRGFLPLAIHDERRVRRESD